MPKLLSEVLGVSRRRLKSLGVFDGFVDVDSRLYVDPHLLAHSATPELKGSRATLDSHFNCVFKLLTAATRPGDSFSKEAIRRLTFREVPNTGLGNAKEDTSGSAIGSKLAEVLAQVAGDIVKAGVQDPDIFNLMGLLQEGIGADRISDMTVAIILPHLLAFSARIAKQLKVPTVTYKHKSGEYAVPVNPSTGLALILVPADVLRHLPVSKSWEDIDLVASHNAALRAAVNPIIGDTWRKATTSVKKKELRRVLLENPELIVDLLKQYKTKAGAAYDIENDPDALQLWHFLTRDLAAEFPLALAAGAAITPTAVIGVVRAICHRFRELIETNRLGRLLYSDDGTPRKEKVAQLALFGIADAYCAANGLDLSPEVDSGAGPVDFKVSHGYSDRVNVEVKLSSNSKLTSGFTKQLPLYDKAEQSVHSFYIIIRTTKSDASIESVKRLHAAARNAGKRVPELIIVDGRPSPSASRA